jgi:hypothetical protein
MLCDLQELEMEEARNNTCIQNQAARCVMVEDVIFKNLLSAKVRVN